MLWCDLGANLDRSCERTFAGRIAFTPNANTVDADHELIMRHTSRHTLCMTCQCSVANNVSTDWPWPSWGHSKIVCSGCVLCSRVNQHQQSDLCPEWKRHSRHIQFVYHSRRFVWHIQLNMPHVRTKEYKSVFLFSS